MKKVLKIAGVVALLLVGGLATFIGTFSPKARATTDLKVEGTPEQVERGDYLVNHVVTCVGCHSQMDINRYAHPHIGPPMGGWSDCFPESMKMPGKLCAPNITPHETGIADYTDDEIIRAFRDGVKNDGSVIFPMMPYAEYKNMSDQDAHAVVAYLNSLEPVDNKVPDTAIDFPVSFFIKMEPQPVEGPVPHPDENDELAWGEYLVSMSCVACHTQVDDKMQLIPGTELGGGREFLHPLGKVVTPNITSHPTGRLPETREAFIGLFKAFEDEESVAQPVTNGQPTVMPWLEYAGMSEKDLGAIWAYLRSAKPQDNKVEKWPDSSAG